MSWTVVLALCLGALFVIFPLKHIKEEYAVFASVALGVIVVGKALGEMTGFFDYIDAMERVAGGGKYFEICFKCCGIGLITFFCCDVCVDCGYPTLAKKAELAGKCAVLVTSLPLFEELFSFVGELLE